MPKYSYFLRAQGSKHVFFYQVGNNGQWNHNTSTVQVFKGNTQPQSYAGEDDTFIFSSGAKVSSFFGKDTEGFTTSVELPATSPGVKSAEENVFNLNGQLVRQGQDSLQDLPAGIYIINGKKYIKK
jgi:formylmethanofuran dehydrogenase subunit A